MRHPPRLALAGLTLLALLAVPLAAAAATPDGAVITTVAGTGTTGFSGDGGPATAARLSNAEGVAVAPNGTILIADTYNNRIREVARDGTIRTIAGTGAAGYTGDGGAATAATLFLPFDVAVAPNGTIYIADTYNSAIRVVTRDGRIDTVAGTGIGGFSGDGPARSAQLRFPFGLSVAPNGDLLIADTFNQRIRALDRSGHLTTVAGTGTSGFSGDGGPATSAQVAFPYDVAHLPGRGFVIADTSNNRIRSVDGAGRIATLAGTGIRTYGGDGGPASAAALGGPHGVAVDRSGRVVIADTFNNRIRAIERDGTISTLAGTGVPAYGGDGGPATAAQVHVRRGIAVWEPGVVVIADTYNARVRIIR